MAKTTAVTTEQAVLLQLADLIYAAFGNSASTKPAQPAEEVEDAPEVEEVEADEADADSLEEEREELMALTLAELRKRLVEAGFDEADVKKEKSKATLVDALLADMYSDEEDEDEDEDEDDTEDDDFEDDEDTDEDEDEDEDADDEEEEEEDDDDEDEELYTEEELSEFSLPELKEIAADYELDLKKGARQKTYIAAILAAQEEAVDEEDEDDEVDEDELREELEALSLSELKKTAKSEYGIPVRELKGLDKDAIVDLILESDFEDEDEDEDDE